MTSDFKKVTEPWVGKEDLWQSVSNPNLFSTDGGETYYDLTESLDSEGNPTIHRSTDG